LELGSKQKTTYRFDGLAYYICLSKL